MLEAPKPDKQVEYPIQVSIGPLEPPFVHLDVLFKGPTVETCDGFPHKVPTYEPPNTGVAYVNVAVPVPFVLYVLKNLVPNELYTIF